MGVFDKGAEGSFRVPVIDDGALKEIADIIGPPPMQGMRWAMVDMYTGIAKWYQRARKKSWGGRRKRI